MMLSNIWIDLNLNEFTFDWIGNNNNQIWIHVAYIGDSI